MSVSQKISLLVEFNDIDGLALRRIRGGEMNSLCSLAKSVCDSEDCSWKLSVIRVLVDVFAGCENNGLGLVFPKDYSLIVERSKATP